VDVPQQQGDRSTGTPYCTAPFTSFVVDPNKNVRPCCTFDGSLGNVERQSLRDVLSGQEWSEVKRQITNGETPAGCVNCYVREQATGWSVRTCHYDPERARSTNWRTALTQIEINSTNVCNLACTHCTSQFSSKWLQLNDKFGKEIAHHHVTWELHVHPPDPDNIVKQLATQDLDHLDEIRFKGGEPMLNRDVPAVLRHLRDRGLLQNVLVHFVSNGSTVNDDVLELLRGARAVSMCISVDGTGAVQDYIRRGPSDIARIERFIAAFSSLPRIRFLLSISVMAYNIFSLDRITDWWEGFRRTDADRFERLEFHLLVVEPPYLSVSVLNDRTRRTLVQKYRARSDADYSSVIFTLEQPFAGIDVHNKFVTYTHDMDRVWKTDVLHVVPELAPEMVLLQPRGPAATAWERARTALSRSAGGVTGAWRNMRTAVSKPAPVTAPPTPSSSWASSPAAPSAANTLKEGLSLSQDGQYEAALRLYERSLGTAPAGSPAATWEIRLHRAIVLGRMEQWDRSLQELNQLVCASPATTLQVVERSRTAGSATVLAAISPSLAKETGFVQTPSFGLLIEGLAYQALDQPQEAAARMDKALELDPEFALAKVARRAVPLGV
jgi:radical SAM protein with 4Fe4S-binding SPASM domain